MKARGLRELVYGEDTIDLTVLEQLVDDSQVRAIGELLRLSRALARLKLPLRDLVRELFREVDHQGLYGLAASPELAMPRPFDVAGAINRLRGLVIEQIDTTAALASAAGGKQVDGPLIARLNP